MRIREVVRDCTVGAVTVSDWVRRFYTAPLRLMAAKTVLQSVYISRQHFGDDPLLCLGLVIHKP